MLNIPFTSPIPRSLDTKERTSNSWKSVRPSPVPIKIMGDFVAATALRSYLGKPIKLPQSTSSFCVAIELSDDAGTNVDHFLEGKGLIVSRLSNSAVHNEDNLIWFDNIRHLFHFFKKIRFLLVATRSVDNNDVVTDAFELFDSCKLWAPASLSHTIFGNLDRISFRVASVEWDVSTSGVLWQLIVGSCTESIGANETRSPLVLPSCVSFIVNDVLVIRGHFGHSSCFTASLETYKHNDVALSSLGFPGLHSRVKQLNQLIKDNLHKVRKAGKCIVPSWLSFVCLDQKPCSPHLVVLQCWPWVAGPTLCSRQMQ